MFVRYAVFYTPPPGDFADFCAAWLGWDSRRGITVPHPQIPNLDPGSLTDTPRKYGFHGTLKAPFRLCADTTEDALLSAVGTFAQTTKSVTLDSMTLQHDHGFLALRPTGDIIALTQLAASIVKDLDVFRAAATADELARRRQSGLTALQDHNLVTWGYPYVFDDFHFHLTLTGRIDAETGKHLVSMLSPMITAIVPRPFPITDIALMGQAADGMFHEIQRYALTG